MWAGLHGCHTCPHTLHAADGHCAEVIPVKELHVLYLVLAHT